MTKEQYDNIPVFYCKKCLSLAVLHVGKYDYCKECGNTDIEYDDLDKWDELFVDKYGKHYLEMEDK